MAIVAYDSTWIQLPLLVASVFVMERSANTFLDSVSAISERLGVDEALIALLTAGAEWEEFAVIVSSLSTQHNDLAYSNVLGSCIANILGGLGVGMIFLPSGLIYDKSTKIYTAFQLLITLLATLIIFNARSWGFSLCAGFLFCIFILYVAVTTQLIWKGSIDAPEDSDDSDSEGDSASSHHSDSISNSTHERPASNERSSLLGNFGTAATTRNLARLTTSLILSAGFISGASYFITTSLIILSKKLHLTESTVGLTILSFITTIPEKFLAVLAGRRAKAGVVVASTAGSNIFLLTLCLGVIFSSKSITDLQIRPLEVYATFACSTALAASVFLLPGTSRWVGLILLLFYCAFFGYEFIDQSV